MPRDTSLKEAGRGIVRQSGVVGFARPGPRRGSRPKTTFLQWVGWRRVRLPKLGFVRSNPGFARRFRRFVRRIGGFVPHLLLHGTQQPGPIVAPDATSRTLMLRYMQHWDGHCCTGCTIDTRGDALYAPTQATNRAEGVRRGTGASCTDGRHKHP